MFMMELAYVPVELDLLSNQYMYTYGHKTLFSPINYNKEYGPIATTNRKSRKWMISCTIKFTYVSSVYIFPYCWLLNIQ